MAMARRGYLLVAMLFVAATVVQVFLGGLNVMSGGEEDIDPHRFLGFALMLAAILLLVLAFLGQLSRTATMLSVGLLVLVVLQSLWVADDQSSGLRAIHPTMALFIFGLGIDLMRRGLVSLRAPATA